MSLPVPGCLTRRGSPGRESRFAAVALNLPVCIAMLGGMIDIPQQRGSLLRLRLTPLARNLVNPDHLYHFHGRAKLRALKGGGLGAMKGKSPQEEMLIMKLRDEMNKPDKEKVVFSTTVVGTKPRVLSLAAYQRAYAPNKREWTVFCIVAGPTVVLPFAVWYLLLF